MDPFEVLGLTPNASAEDAQEAYRSLAQIFHPDRYADSPPRVKEEAERRMKELTGAYSAVKKAVRLRDEAARQQVIDLDEADVGDPPAVATPLPCPEGPYSKQKWDIASRVWRWSDDLLAWECEHGKEVCTSCGRNPDVIAVHDGGVARPANTWRRSKTGTIICASHRDEWCRRCRPLSDDDKRRLDSAPGQARVRPTREW